MGLALSSGGAKGLAHIGVIQVLEENGIPVDVVVGCSMGAYVAAVWATGHNGVQMEKLAREIEGRWGWLPLIDPVFPPRAGFIRGEAVKKRLKKSVGDAEFGGLARPLRIVATNLTTLERVVFSSGEVAAAVHASCAIPGLCVPVKIGTETYIDGGITDPLPVDVLREMGVDRILAVNTIPTPAYLGCCREMEREQSELRPKRGWFLRAVNRHLNYFAHGNILDNLLHAFYGAQMSVAEAACRQAHLVLRPLACDASWHDFTHPAKYIALGRRVAEEHLDEIKSLLRAPESSDEHTSSQLAMAAAA
ncbi:MAG: patatin-like phospholipase family protein [Verrucomicrobia bacterium]|nr:patatin-like phospholipase family protein [Verrucomicrobiota bacterium]